MIVLGGGHPDDLTGYIGPRGLYDRYMRGEVVTQTDALSDQSEWVTIPESKLGAENRRRLWWMVENLERIHGKVRRRRSGERDDPPTRHDNHACQTNKNPAK